MQGEREIDAVYRLLDDQLLDSDGRRCGRVDDLLFSGAPGERVELVAILAGHGTWHRRIARPLRGVARRVFGAGVLGRDVIQIPWAEVDAVETTVKLRRKAYELGLAQGDERVTRLVGEVPDE